MGRQEANEQFLITSFLDGSNAAYIEQLYARYEEDPSSVSDEWQAFFKALADNPTDVKKAAKGARVVSFRDDAGSFRVRLLDADGSQLLLSVRFADGPYGGYQAIMVNPEGGYIGASESRKDGQAAGY